MSAVLGLLSACARDVPTPPSLRRSPPRPESPLALPPPEPSALQGIPGHSLGDAGIPPAPTAHSGPLLGWDLAPFDDGFNRDDVAWLVLTERTPDGHRRDLVHVGARGGCHEIAPPMLHGVGDAGFASAVRSVRCDTPEPVTFHLLRGEDGRWLVARAGCVRPSRACGPTRTPDTVVGTARVPSDVVYGRLTGPLERRAEGPPLPADAVQCTYCPVALRLVATHPVDDATGITAYNLTLLAAGQRVDFGAVTDFRALTAAERRAHRCPPHALLAIRCELLDEGPRPVVVTRTGDVLSIQTRGPDDMALLITRRVGLPVGSSVPARCIPPSHEIPILR